MFGACSGIFGGGELGGYGQLGGGESSGGWMMYASLRCGAPITAIPVAVMASVDPN